MPEGIDAIGQNTCVKSVQLDIPGKTTKVRGILTSTFTGGLMVNTCKGYEKVIETLLLHYGRINSFVLTPDHKTLFTAGADGAVFVLKVSD